MSTWMSNTHLKLNMSKLNLHRPYTLTWSFCSFPHWIVNSSSILPAVHVNIFRFILESSLYQPTCNWPQNPMGSTFKIIQNFKKIYFYILQMICLFIYLFIYLLESEEGREKERERNINVWLPLMRPLLRTWPTTQAHALTGNWTGDSLVRRPVVNPLSHSRRGYNYPEFDLTISLIQTTIFSLGNSKYEFSNSAFFIGVLWLPGVTTSSEFRTYPGTW